MKTWQEDHIQALQSIQCEQQFFQTLTAMVRDLGFEYCAYGSRMPFPLSRPKTCIFNNYPATWQARYESKNYLAIDPTVRHGMLSPVPIVWSDDLFVPVRELWEEARSFGLRFGWAQSIRGFDGVSGMLTLARPNEPIAEKELKDKRFKMSWLAQAAHLGMSRCLSPKFKQDLDVKLSNREVEVLRWTAEGKTSSEISTILDIAERTVNFHIANVIAKLNAANKTAAAIRAAMLGLL